MSVRGIIVNVKSKSAVESKVNCPFFAFNKLCYAYLNNDWVLVFSSIFAIAISLIILVMGALHKVIS